MPNNKKNFTIHLYAKSEISFRGQDKMHFCLSNFYLSSKKAQIWQKLSTLHYKRDDNFKFYLVSIHKKFLFQLYKKLKIFSDVHKYPIMGAEIFIFQHRVLIFRRNYQYCIIKQANTSNFCYWDKKKKILCKTLFLHTVSLVDQK